MSATLPGELIYRVILDYEALHEMFRDRVEDLNTSRDSIDVAGKFTPGYAAKLLCNPPMRMLSRESLGKMLDATGMVLVAVVDDERFATVKSTLAVRKRRDKLPNGSIRQPAWLITRKASQNMQFLRNKKLSPRQRRMIAKRAARIRWKRVKQNTEKTA
jgi:hypothetical protein